MAAIAEKMHELSSSLRVLLLLLPLLTLTCSVTLSEAHLIDGIFTEPTLKLGYNLVATIPRGALALNVTELRRTQNYLAIRLQNGSYLVNGNYNINWSGEYKAAGTTFVYLREGPQNLESFSAVGPLREPIDVMVLYQEPNPGIVYRYIVPSGTGGPANPHFSPVNRPVEAASSIPLSRKTNGTTYTTDDATTISSYLTKRLKRRKFAWKADGYTECNKSCGGGTQLLRYICVKEHTQSQVPEKRCHALEKPREVRLRCNTKPCPAKWRASPWSACSVTCGNGIRSRTVECVQEIRPDLTLTVPEGACMEDGDVAASESCVMPSCEDEFTRTTASVVATQRWIVGPWSECSVSCGTGTKTRSVTCESHERYCAVEEKPDSREPCRMDPCAANLASPDLHSSEFNSQWLYTEWPDECSSACGPGVQTRRVVCDSRSGDENCDSKNQPESSRSCSSNKTCSGQWFTGPWTECSSACGSGEETREAVCITSLHGTPHVVLDMNCPPKKPETKRSCRGAPCAPTWFTSDWSECSRSCGKGLQWRNVKCFSSEGEELEFQSNAIFCDDEKRPASRRICNDYPCKSELRGFDNYQRTQLQNDLEMSNGVEEDPSCKDNMPNCILVIQARLCSYQFYRRSCCLSCSRLKHEFE